MKFKQRKMKMRKIRHIVLLYAVFLLLNSSPLVLGARVAGEDGITSTISSVEQKPEKAPPTKADTTAQSENTPPAQVPPSKTQAMPSPSNSQAASEPNTAPIGKKDQEAEKRESSDRKKVLEEAYVTIDFDDVDIPIFIKFISELTGKNFVIDKAVRGKVTIISPKKISVKEAYKVFESVLDVHGFTTVPAGSIIKIVPTVDARGMNVETLLKREAVDADDKVATQLIPLKYADPEELKKLFTPLISKNSVMVAYSPTQTLIVTDVLSNIERLLKITKAIDVEGVGEQITVLPLRYAAADVLAKSVNTLFQQSRVRHKNAPQTQNTINVVPDQRTNSLILLASEDDTVRIVTLVKLLDKEPPRGEGDIRVYYLQHANAEDLTKVLTALPSKQDAEATKGKTPVLSKEARIVADKATNSLVITAGKDDYLVLEEVIRKLDIPRLMVYIEALIMEVNVNKNFQLGVEWEGAKDFSYNGKQGAAFAGSSSSGFSKFANLATNAALPAGFSLGVIGEAIEIAGIKFPNLAAIVTAYQQDQDVNILSTPQILTTDNEEAEIMVGKNIPYITSKNTNATLQDYTNYQYKDVGVTLKVTPQISKERHVRLKIFQEITRLIPGGELTDQPSTYKRMAQTTVIVKDANTIVIAGLIGDDTTDIEYSVPCLGGIPVLGWLFRSSTKTREKTNLFIFLTPRIIENPLEARTIYQDKKDHIDRIKEGVIKMYKKPAPNPSDQGEGK
mgnify:CR=1 FL=1